MLCLNHKESIIANRYHRDGLKKDNEQSKVVILVLGRGQRACVGDKHSNSNVIYETCHEHANAVGIFISAVVLQLKYYYKQVDLQE
jgi:hypothetical protein